MSVQLQKLTRTALLLALALAVQSMGLPQPLTGPLVNLILLTALFAVGPVWAMLLGALTPIGAMLLGITPPPAAPALPIIALGNATLIGLVWLCWRILTPYGALLFGAGVKWAVIRYGILWLTAVPEKVALALSAPQFLTALVGGAGALLILRVLAPSGWLSAPKR